MIELEVPEAGQLWITHENESWGSIRVLSYSDGYVVYLDEDGNKANLSLTSFLEEFDLVG